MIIYPNLNTYMNVLNTSRRSQRLLFIFLVTLFWGFDSTQSYAAINFESPIGYEIPTGASVITHADFDGDGDIDLALAHVPNEDSYEDEGVFIHLNNGDGSYVLGSRVHNTDSRISSITSADLDNDGDIDLASANTGSEDMTIFLNDGNAVFTIDSSLKLENDLRSVLDIATADFDHDNDIDIAMYVSNSNGGYNGPAVVLYINDGTANFVRSTILYTYFAGYGLGPIISEDLNGDTFDDIAVIAGDLHIFYNNGDGTFTYNQTGLPSDDPTTSITPLDVDGDEDLDLITNQSGLFGIMLNIDETISDPDGNGIYFSHELFLDIPPAEGAYSTTDLDNDGDFDIAIVSHTGLYIYLQNNLNDFIPQEPISNPYFTGGDRMISTDINNDDKTDIIVLIDENSIENRFLIFLQTSTENQQPILNEIGNQTAAEGQALNFTVSATDPDEDTLTYAAANLPAGAIFNPVTQTFTWTPGYSDAGNYTDIEFSVTDSGTPMELDVELITITVGDVNRAPEINNPGPQEVLENTPLTFSISATDPDGDDVTVTTTDLPTGATFNGSTFTWTPTLTQEGIYTITFTATDDGAPNESSITEVVITVGDNPTPTEQAEDLVDSVITIDIPQNVENSYLANLLKVGQFIEDGKITAAVNQLNAFITKVNQDRQQGILTQAEADVLIEMAERLIAYITN